MGHLHGGCKSSMFRIQGHNFPESIPSPIPVKSKTSNYKTLQQFLELNTIEIISHKVPLKLFLDSKSFKGWRRYAGRMNHFRVLD